MILDPKDPAETVDYEFEWKDLLNGDTIDTSAWVIGAGVTSPSDSKTSTITIVWVTGGTAGTDYALTNRIISAGGRTFERTMTLPVREL